jgi:hypothetical protein
MYMYSAALQDKTIVTDLTNVVLYSIFIQCVCIPVILHCKYFTIYSNMSYQSVCDYISFVLFRNNLYSWNRIYNGSLKYSQLPNFLFDFFSTELYVGLCSCVLQTSFQEHILDLQHPLPQCWYMYLNLIQKVHFVLCLFHKILMWYLQGSNRMTLHKCRYYFFCIFSFVVGLCPFSFVCMLYVFLTNVYPSTLVFNSGTHILKHLFTCMPVAGKKTVTESSTSTQYLLKCYTGPPF